MFSPLEQFEVIPLIPIYFLYYDISITNVTISLLFIVVTIIHLGLFNLAGLAGAIIPYNSQLVIEKIFAFIVELINQQIGAKHTHLLPIFSMVFVFILFSNLLGLIPFGFTPTAQIIITFLIAFSFNLGFIFLGLILHGYRFFLLFIHEAPLVLVPLITVIEILSYSLRTFSLSIRLFANMMAGHTLLHILGSFVLMFFKKSHFLLALFPFALVLAIFILELGIAFLQSYVFIVLLAIYLAEILEFNH